jgi:membrane associated rhomboid family serine protease
MDDSQLGRSRTDGSAARTSDAALDQALTRAGPLPPPIAQALLQRGRERLDAGEPALAAADFQRLIGNDDPAVTGAAWLGLGDALYRLDRDDDAGAAWEAATRLRENPSIYRAWRNLAALRVRKGDLRGAIDAYREADRRAPAEDKPEIASRLGWLAKETGNRSAANRYFARSRGTGFPVGVSQLVLLGTVVVSLVAMGDQSGALERALWLDHPDVIHGQLYRLLSVTLVHAGLLHLALNMYALWIIGPIAEGIWGPRLFGLFYLLTAIGGSTASFLFGAPGIPSVGASGAILGLVGVLMAGTRAHNPVLDRRARQIVPQLGLFVILTLAFGFVPGTLIDNSAHIGGLLVGLWLGFLVPPGKVPTLQSAWQHPAGQATERSPLLIGAGIAALIGVLATALAFGGATLRF